MLDLHHLRTFVVMVTSNGFTRAAKELGCSQSTVTLHIKLLERELGALLVERNRFSKTSVLTAAGKQVFEHATQLLTLADGMKTTVQGFLAADIALNSQSSVPPLTTMLSEDTSCPNQSKNAVGGQTDSRMIIKAALQAK